MLSVTHYSLIEDVTQNTVLWCIGYGAYLISINSGLCIGTLLLLLCMVFTRVWFQTCIAGGQRQTKDTYSKSHA